MFKYEIEIISEDNGVLHYSFVDFKSVDLAVSHLLSAMDCGKRITFRPKSEIENEN